MIIAGHSGNVSRPRVNFFGLGATGPNVTRQKIELREPASGDLGQIRIRQSSQHMRVERPPLSPQPRLPHARHREHGGKRGAERGNVVFMDGHAETIRSRDFWPESGVLFSGSTVVRRHFDPDGDGNITTPKWPN